MYIKRDITQLVTSHRSWVQVLLGPRQCGKSTLFISPDSSIDLQAFQEITFDDFQMRQLANQDPSLFLQQFSPPLLLDEVQYAPNLFPEIKKIIDQLKRKATFQPDNTTKPTILFRLTGSNQILMDKNIRESMAGRASYFYLNTLSVHEILNALPDTSIKDILSKGGWPELYANNQISIITYLNDYLRSYVEKDIVLAAGIQKLLEFQTVLRLLAARTAQETRYTDIANNSGVSSVTIKEWVGLLERADLIYLLKPYSNNLNSRLIKSPKLYFLDTGLATRLRGWTDATPFISNPQIGALFETLVLAEIVKYIRNYGKDWELFFFRTKDGEEVDFIIKTPSNHIYALEAKMAVQGMHRPIEHPEAFKKLLSTSNPLAVVTYGGKPLTLSRHCITIPIAQLHEYLSTIEN